MLNCYKWTSDSYDRKIGDTVPTLCATNFTEAKTGVFAGFNRPSFLGNSIIIADYKDVPMPSDLRVGNGNNEIVRVNFTAPQVQPRYAIDFDKLNEQDVNESGIKVQLSDKTLNRLFKIQVKDRNDKEWIDEYTRRRALGETAEQLRDNPPLGRQQREITQTTNFAQQGLTLDSKLNRLYASVRAGFTESKQDMAAIVVETARIVGDIANLNAMTGAQLTALGATINRLSIPKSYVTAGFTHRLFTGAQYRAQQGLVNLFILSNVGDRSLDQPLLSMAANRALTPMRISSMVTALSLQPSRYLDIQTRTVILQAEAFNLANAGMDGGQLDGQDPPPGGWQ